MIVKVRYIGTTDGGLVNNAVYVVVGWNGDKPIVLDSNNVISPTGTSITETGAWQLVSVDAVAGTRFYP